MSVLNTLFRPNKEAAKEHIKLTIKHYSDMESISLERQLKVAKRGLYIAGFSWKEIDEIVSKAKEEMGI